MKVLLIAPDLHRVGGQQNYKKQSKALLPPLGLMTVAGLTPPEVEVEVVDETIRPLDYDQPADLVGITANTASAPRAYEIAAAFRRRKIPVVMGGIHATALPEEALQHVDTVGWGEAEGFWPQLLEDFQKGNLKRLYRGELPSLEAFDSRPRRDFLKPKDYLLFNNVQTTRGCPMNCSFCSVTKFFGGQYRTRPLEQVMAEVEELPPGPVIFVDDNILGSREYSKRLFQAVAPLHREWMGQASMNRLEDDEMVQLAAKSGCRILFVGLESLSPENLKDVHKGFNHVERFGELVKKLHKFGIGILGAFIFGLDHDDESVFANTVKFAEETKLDVVQFAIRIPLPGTTDREALEAEGRIFDRDWSHYDGVHAVFQPRLLSPAALRTGLEWAYSRFYSLPSIFRRMWGHRGRHKPLSWKTNLAFRIGVKYWRNNSKEEGPLPTPAAED